MSGDPDGQRGLDGFHLKPTRCRHRLRPRFEDPPRVSFLNFSPGLFVESTDLPHRRQSEATVKGFRDSLITLQAQVPDSAKCLEAEAAARIQVTQLQKQLESYQEIYGQSGDMSKQLEKKEVEVKQLRLQVAQHMQTETALYTELERLSTAWEALDKEVKNKLFDLASVEDRLSKSAIEVSFVVSFP